MHNLLLGGLVIGLGRETLVAQRAHPLEPPLGEGDVAARGLDVGSGQFRRIAERNHVGLRAGDRGVGLGDLQAERLGVDPEQELSHRHVGTLGEFDIDDLPAHFGADRDHVLFEVSIVGRDLAGEALPIKKGTNRERERNREQHTPA